MTPEAALALARELALADGRRRYVAPAVNEQTGDVALAILEAEPDGDHLRVEANGSAIAVYPPSRGEQ